MQNIIFNVDKQMHKFVMPQHLCSATSLMHPEISRSWAPSPQSLLRVLIKVTTVQSDIYESLPVLHCLQKEFEELCVFLFLNMSVTTCCLPIFLLSFKTTV